MTAPSKDRQMSDGRAALATRFAGDRRGNVAILFGLALVPMTIFAGGALDYVQASRARMHLQGAVDAAALSTGRSGSLTESERVQRAVDVFSANIAGSPVLAGTTPVVNSTSLSATVSAQADIPTAFLKVVGIDTLTVTAQASVSYRGKKIELALMTDITGSMDQTRNGARKIDGLKLAAQDLLDIILPDGGQPDQARVALVPFANYVNAGSHAAEVTGEPATKTSSGVTEYLITCVTERTGPDAYTDAAPGPSSYVGASSQGTSGNNYSADGVCYRDRATSSSPLPEVMPLTNDKAALMAQVNSFEPAGSTAGHLGTAWAWYMLAPSWNSIWGLSPPPAAYDDEKVIKAVVLMTDGLYNTQYTSTESRAQALSLCTAMKTAGLTVFTVGLGFTPGSSDPDEVQAVDLLTQCASGTGHYFFPYDGDALRSAFTQIGQQVATAAGQAILSN